jgi:hypothetical protein
MKEVYFFIVIFMVIPENRMYLFMVAIINKSLKNAEFSL